MIAITDPAATMERCFERIHELEAMQAYYDERFPSAAARNRRQIAAYRATITRCSRMLQSAS
jgi:hypothetical protein